MIILRNNLNDLYILINKMGSNSKNIYVQYKILTLKKYLQNEYIIYQEQCKQLQQFIETDENNQPIRNEHGGVKIQDDKKNECIEMLNEINNIEIQIPDLYFSLDELEPLNLTFDELELLMPFIKE
jgi:hypothetical protein